MLLMKDLFGVLESSPEWKQVYKFKVEEYCGKLGVCSTQSMTLQSHFVELCSTFKNRTQGLSLQASAPKCPASFDVDITEVDNYVVNIHEFLINNMKILNSEEVVKV
jgi:hypothetical protein